MKELLEEIVKPKVLRQEPKEEDYRLLIKNAVFVRQDGSLIKVRHEDILWLKGDGNYTVIHSRKGVFSVRNILKDFETLLPEDQFLRIHKSYMVQLDCIEEITQREVKIGDELIPLGRTFHQKLVSGIQKLGNISD